MKDYGTCPLIPKAARVPGNCGWCGKALPRTKTGKIHRSRRWCSRSCSSAYADNHYWKDAREIALARDGHRCQSCGKSPYDHPRPEYADFDTDDEWRDAVSRWQEEIKPLRLQVHHVDPVNGRGYSQSCLHHQGNLLTLCKVCHKQAHA